MSGVKNLLSLFHRSIDEGNTVSIPRWSDIRIRVRGRNNKVFIPQEAHGRMKILINGDNNTIVINSTARLNINVNIGFTGSACQNISLEIGEKTSMSGVYFFLLENNSYIKIGEDCLFSKGIEIWCSDAHSICNKNSKVLNIGKSIEIGNHVWVGKNCYITKNTKISDNSVIGWCSNVTRKFEEKNVIIAGNPAQIVKKGIDWKGEAVQTLLNQEIE